VLQCYEVTRVAGLRCWKALLPSQSSLFTNNFQANVAAKQVGFHKHPEEESAGARVSVRKALLAPSTNQVGLHKRSSVVKLALL
jgi:hypothetical protein